MNPIPDNVLPNSVELMEAFLLASKRSGGDARDAYLARETLHSILRLARNEQLFEIRRSVDKLVPASVHAQPAKRGKTRRAPRAHPGQKQFVFGREN